MFEIELTICIKIDLALNNLQRLNAIKPNQPTKIIHKKALPMESSIFTAETCAVDLTLNIISKEKHEKFIIFSDSLPVLLSLNNKKNGRIHLS